MAFDLNQLQQIESAAFKVWEELCQLENGDFVQTNGQPTELEIMRRIGICRKDMELLKRQISQLRGMI